MKSRGTSDRLVSVLDSHGFTRNIFYWGASSPFIFGVYRLWFISVLGACGQLRQPRVKCEDRMRMAS